MKDLTYLAIRAITILLSSTLCACVVVPKKVASYDKNCMVSTQKIELTVEQMQVFNFVNCVEHSCSAEIIGALATSTLVTTTSAIVSGSIALVGNTLYWAESQGKCRNLPRQDERSPKTPSEKTNEEYLITEEIVTAKS